MFHLCITVMYVLCRHGHVCVFPVQGQPPPEEGEGKSDGEQAGDKKQKENTAYAKKMVLRLAGLMGLGGAVGIVYIFGDVTYLLFV